MLRRFPEVVTVVSRVGSPELATDVMGIEVADVFVILKPKSEWTTARTTGATVYAIGFGTNVDVERLVQLTTATGGEAYFTNDVSELGEHYQRIVDDLHRRYTVAYTSTNAERNGGWRTVGIKTTDPALKVRSPSGYFAPAQ